MKKFKVRPGIVLATICGEDLLIATKQASVYCQKARHINETGADIIRLLLQSPRSLEEILHGLSEIYDIPEGTVEKDTRMFIDILMENGYVIVQEEQVDPSESFM